MFDMGGRGFKSRSGMNQNLVLGSSLLRSNLFIRGDDNDLVGGCRFESQSGQNSFIRGDIGVWVWVPAVSNLIFIVPLYSIGTRFLLFNNSDLFIFV